MPKKFVLPIISVLLFILLGLSGCAQQGQSVPKVQNGTLDIRGSYELLEKETIPLEGDWAFYWKRFLLGSELASTQPDLYGVVPKAWNHYTLDGEKLSPDGYATYRVHVQSDIPAGTVMGLQVPYFASAYRLYINDRLVAENGVAATSGQDEVGQFSPKAVYFAIPDQSFDIVIQVSNFELAYGGFWNTMSLGTADSVRQADLGTCAKIISTYVIILLVGAYALILYIGNRELRYCLYFALLCLFSVLTMDTADQQILLQGLIKLRFSFFVCLWFSSSHWCVFFLLLLCHELYPSKLSAVCWKGYLAICVGFQLLYSVTGTLFYTNTSDLHNAVTVLGIVLATAVAIYGIIKGHKEGWSHIVGMGILLAVYIHDVLLLTNVIDNPIGKIYYFGILLCVLLMMSVLVRLNRRYYERMEASELALLQAQIKPHFIFNTINALIALSYEDVGKTRKLMGQFSQYLRDSFDFTATNQFVSFEKEMGYVEAFVEIEKARFEEQLAIEFEIDEGITANVPILVLQPVIENAIIHGVLPKANGGHVLVTVKNQGEQLVFCVQDDGVGFDQERWQKTKGKSTGSGVGLYNIDQRLKKLTKRGLTIHSELGSGTQVCWSVPVGKRRK